MGRCPTFFKKNGMKDIFDNRKYKKLLDNIGETFLSARKRAFTAVNTELTIGNWQTGKYIVEYEQDGKIKAEYGKKLILRLSRDLSLQYGKGFNKSNLVYMRLFYVKYSKGVTTSHLLSWSHYYELLKISDDIERDFYEQQIIIENWGVRELRRQKRTALFQRIAVSKDKKQILELSKKGHLPKNETDIGKNPFVFEFLGVPENNTYTETELEKKLINNLQQFLLELGKGFAFVGRQYRIMLANKHFYVDLVFYHYILDCFVLIDLKVNEVEHKDVGQMITYLNFFNAEVKKETDKETIGIILTSGKDDVFVEYATETVTNKLAVSEYTLYLPDKKSLKQKVREILDNE